METYINRLQIRIVKAVQGNKWRLVRRLQYLITHSFYGKALAVKRVISNKGKNTPGIDGKVWKTDKEKMEAIIALQTNGYRASALRRIYIEKFGKKEKRPLGIPTMKDRAMQAVQLLGLEPVAETLAEIQYHSDSENTEELRRRWSMDLVFYAEKIHHNGYLRVI